MSTLFCRVNSVIKSKLSKIVFFSILLLTLVSPVAAQTTSTSSANIIPAYTTLPTQSPNTALKAFYDFGHAMNCVLIGKSLLAPCLEYKIVQDTKGMLRSVPYLSNAQTDSNNGLLGFSMSLIGEVIATPPVKSSEFIANLGEQIGIKSANAQVGGSGNNILTPIFKLWEVSRNISYLAMILIFVAVGLMVMFRQKLNPQTVVTIQMALPGLVIGLVMITFSYFLASLISDIAFIGTNVVGYYFSLADPSITQPTQLPLAEKTSTGDREANVLTIFSRYTGIVGTLKLKQTLDSIWPYLDDPQRGNFPLVGGVGLSGIDGMDPKNAITILANMLAIQFILPFGGLFGGVGQTVAGSIPPVVTALGGTTFLIAYSMSWIAMLALIYSMIRLLLRLINCVLGIIFLTITAPFHFLAASLPGREGIATNWMFNMLCNVLAFPAVFAVFYFVAFLLKGQTSNGIDPLFQVGKGTDIITGAAFPLLGGIRLNFLNTLIAFGALVALPSVPDVICKAVGKPSALGGAIGGAVGAAIGQGQKYQGQVEGGAKGFTGNVGRLTDQKNYHLEKIGEDGKPIYGIDPYHSRAGLVKQIGLNWKNWRTKGAKETPAAPDTPKA